MPSIKLNSISGKGVKSLVIFQKPTLYAVVFLSSGDKKNKKKTSVDRTNGENPEWDQAMLVDIDSRDPDLILQFDLKAEAILGDRLVGKARIRVADLNFSGSVQHASYQLRTKDGKPNGVLNFSYWIEAPDLGAAPAAAVQVPVSAPVANYSPPPSSPAPVVNYSPLPSAPAAGLYPDLSYPPSALVDTAPPVPVSASGYYPAADPVAIYPRAGHYPPQDSAVSYPPQQSGPGYYPPQDSTTSYPPPPVSAAAADYYPPPPPTAGYFSAAAADYYPPPPPTAGYFSAAAADYYPPPPPTAGYYPQPGTHITAYPPPQGSQHIPECCDRSLPQPAPGWGYPPPPSAAGYYPPPGTHIAAYPPPQGSQQIPECCDRSLPQPAPGWGYPPPPSAAGYYLPSETHIAAYPPPQESQQMAEYCDRSLLQPTPGWGYPSGAAPCCNPSPAPGVYGYRQDCWNHGSYSYT